jgi:hypothetical protein
MSSWNKSYAKEERKERAKSQRLFLLKEQWKSNSDENQDYLCDVLGTTGNVYHVNYVDDNWSCTCPDYLKREANCKHIYFVLYRVLKWNEQCSKHAVDTNIARRKQEYNSQEQVQQQKNTTPNQQQQVYAPDIVLQEYQALQGGDQEKKTIEQKPYIDEPCAICFEEMTSTCTVIYCTSSCGKSVHKECFANYLKHKKDDIVPCVYCRAPMDLYHYGFKKSKIINTSDTGYKNLKSAKYV